MRKRVLIVFVWSKKVSLLVCKDDCMVETTLHIQYALFFGEVAVDFLRRLHVRDTQWVLTALRTLVAPNRIQFVWLLAEHYTVAKACSNLADVQIPAYYFRFYVEVLKIGWFITFFGERHNLWTTSFSTAIDASVIYISIRLLPTNRVCWKPHAISTTFVSCGSTTGAKLCWNWVVLIPSCPLWFYPIAQALCSSSRHMRKEPPLASFMNFTFSMMSWLSVLGSGRQKLKDKVSPTRYFM